MSKILKKNSIELYEIFGQSKFQCKNKKNDFFEFSSNMVEFLTSIFMSQIILVVTENYEFGKRNVSKLVVNFEIYCTIKILLQGIESTVFQKD